MAFLTGLLASRRKKSRERLVRRAAEVIEHVLLDIGVDRFVNGTLLLDKKLRLHFFAMEPAHGPEIIASVPVCQLAEARMLRRLVDDVAQDTAPPNLHTGYLVQGLMREFKAQSPAVSRLS
ncbi:hypothetical protein [Massilia horti]|uniref:Uncharacterized protein n=1 Tax=Massilia horti TaxID=2562153 RepID=A0A4Y9SRV7_9BURK|nr:hypothetical protein [Massilia horti]TFW27944.1 hypothetical protein E4O92_22525 [Massilia horti]